MTHRLVVLEQPRPQTSVHNGFLHLFVIEANLLPHPTCQSGKPNVDMATLNGLRMRPRLDRLPWLMAEMQPQSNQYAIGRLTHLI